MDEIITRWATDLTKYQKDFAEQAEKVADWDRMLVENGNKVQKLYVNTVEADRATQEVERQLTTVENNQNEVDNWLSFYEQKVDEMLANQVGPGEPLTGADADREQIYKTAEAISERLDEMGQGLTEMIEEVNSTSASLSKTNRADEPVSRLNVIYCVIQGTNDGPTQISQIVRILNSHLSQLLVIDKDTSDLQAKVAAAQKAGQSISSRLGYAAGSPGKGGSSVVDDFHRSFMGRR